MAKLLDDYEIIEVNFENQPHRICRVKKNIIISSKRGKLVLEPPELELLHTFFVDELSKNNNGEEKSGTNKRKS